ncbi:MAG: crotonase/enoyl-CoA hydratase family protein [Gammaproteobacteria bacterium]|nr:crotonase/enoyl-CoA hydratase family protein [Gammaproteobacteria bacterium]
MSDPVLLTVDDRVATLTLNRPEHLNAIDYALADHLMAHLDAIEPDDSIGAVILTGAGERAFSAGADIHEFSKSVKQGEAIAVNEFVRRGQTMTARLEAFPKPVIAAVNGLAFGGGCEITEAVHLAIAAESAVFAKPEILLGMPPTFGGTQRLPRVAGTKRALELLLTGQTFNAQRAVELGLANRVVPDESLLHEAHHLATRITSQSPRAVRSILTAVTRGIDLPIGDGLLVEREQFARMVGTQDLHDGLKNWQNRRGNTAAVS